MHCLKKMNRFTLVSYIALIMIAVIALVSFPRDGEWWFSSEAAAGREYVFDISLPLRAAQGAWPPYNQSPWKVPSGERSNQSLHSLLSDSFVNPAPTRVVPFYYQSRFSRKFMDSANRDVQDLDDITITTLVTSNRFSVLADLAQQYKGPISATIHVTIPQNFSDSNTTEFKHLRHALSSLHKLYANHPFLSTYADIHLVLSPPSLNREFNLWRNVARYYAITSYVMMLDVDFVVCTDFRTRILAALNQGVSGEASRTMESFREGTVALVVPAFEYSDLEEGTKVAHFPKDKRTLVNLARDGKIGMFHKAWLPGHGSTDYERFYETQAGEIYPVTKYQHSYEPYIVFKKDGPPW